MWTASGAIEQGFAGAKQPPALAVFTDPQVAMVGDRIYTDMSMARAAGAWLAAGAGFLASAFHAVYAFQASVRAIHDTLKALRDRNKLDTSLVDVLVRELPELRRGPVAA